MQSKIKQIEERSTRDLETVDELSKVDDSIKQQMNTIDTKIVVEAAKRETETKAVNENIELPNQGDKSINHEK